MTRSPARSVSPWLMIAAHQAQVEVLDVTDGGAAPVVAAQVAA